MISGVASVCIRCSMQMCVCDLSVFLFMTTSRKGMAQRRRRRKVA
jgi:hypothetical protein